MNIKLAAAAFAAVALATPVLAANVELTDGNKSMIVKMLTADGYEVGKIKLEDGMYEAYAKKGGNRYEVFLNGDFEVIKVKED